MPIEKVCEHCDQAFRVKPFNSDRKYCCQDCRRAHEAVHGQPSQHAQLIFFTCRECGNKFSMKPSYVTAYRKKFGRDQPYCSTACASIGRRKDTMERQRFTCIQCGKEQSRRRKPGGRVYMQQKFCDHKCKADHQRTQALSRFNAGEFGRHVKRNGYVWISVPSLVTGKKHSIMEHRYVMEKSIGRSLYPEETVHHIDGNRQNNAPSNLELFSSRHGPGQRVADKVAFAIEILKLYPEFGRAAGYELVQCSIPKQVTALYFTPGSEPISSVL